MIKSLINYGDKIPNWESFALLEKRRKHIFNFTDHWILGIHYDKPNKRSKGGILFYRDVLEHLERFERCLITQDHTKAGKWLIKQFNKEFYGKLRSCDSP
jgi:hypothetical protein